MVPRNIFNGAGCVARSTCPHGFLYPSRTELLSRLSNTRAPTHARAHACCTHTHTHTRANEAPKPLSLHRSIITRGDQLIESKPDYDI